jgi:hypothetical protein
MASLLHQQSEKGTSEMEWDQDAIDAAHGALKVVNDAVDSISTKAQQLDVADRAG